MMGALPDFVIIGAGKSASTWLHLALRQHPAVYMPRDETPFFEDPYYDADGIDSLRAALQAAPAGAVIGIKRPNYLCTPECPPRLAKHLPHAKLIAILRNPVDRAVSQYYHLIRSGRFPLLEADIAFSRYLAGRFDPPYAKQLVMEFGLYAEGIGRYRGVFPSDQLLILTDLDMQSSSPAEVFKRVCRFVNIDDTFTPAGISMPRNQGVYFSPLLSFVQSMNHYGQSFDPATGLVTTRPGPVAWGARCLALLGSRLSAASRIFVRDQEPAVSPGTKARLLEFYLADIVKLEAMTNIDLAAWKRLPQA